MIKIHVKLFICEAINMTKYNPFFSPSIFFFPIMKVQTLFLWFNFHFICSNFMLTCLFYIVYLADVPVCCIVKKQWKYKLKKMFTLFESTWHIFILIWCVNMRNIHVNMRLELYCPHKNHFSCWHKYFAYEHNYVACRYNVYWM